MDPSNPNVLYAALVADAASAVERLSAVERPGSGLYKSTDAGATWTQLTAGLPARRPHRHLRFHASNPAARLRVG